MDLSALSGNMGTVRTLSECICTMLCVLGTGTVVLMSLCLSGTWTLGTKSLCKCQKRLSESFSKERLRSDRH